MKLEKLAPLLPEGGAILLFDDGTLEKNVPMNKYFDRKVKNIGSIAYTEFGFLASFVAIELEGKK